MEYGYEFLLRRALLNIAESTFVSYPIVYFPVRYPMISVYNSEIVDRLIPIKLEGLV